MNRLLLRRPLFDVDDVEQANETWGANCGPCALAAITNLTLDQVRLHLRGFEDKHYTNPTMMFDALGSLHRCGFIGGWTDRSKDREKSWPEYGLVRVQWEGPWTRPGVPQRVRYRHTHWVAAAFHSGGVGVFDVNCMNNGSGWVRFEDWRTSVVPYILENCEPKADGRWHLTHVIELEQDCDTAAPPSPLSNTHPPTLPHAPTLARPRLPDDSNNARQRESSPLSRVSTGAIL